MTLEDGIDIIIHVIVQLHLDKLWIFTDGQVEEFFCEHILLTFAVKGFVCNFAFLKLYHSFFKGDS